MTAIFVSGRRALSAIDTEIGLRRAGFLVGQNLPAFAGQSTPDGLAIVTRLNATTFRVLMLPEVAARRDRAFRRFIDMATGWVPR